MFEKDSNPETFFSNGGRSYSAESLMLFKIMFRFYPFGRKKIVVAALLLLLLLMSLLLLILL